MRFCSPATLLSLDLKVVAESTFLAAGCEEAGILGYLVTNFVRTLSSNLVMNLVTILVTKFVRSLVARLYETVTTVPGS